MVEKKCVEVCTDRAKSAEKLKDDQWQALIALHRTLLHEHHDVSCHLCKGPLGDKVSRRIPAVSDFITVLPRLTASDRLSSPPSTRQQVCYAGSHVEAWDSCFP